MPFADLGLNPALVQAVLHHLADGGVAAAAARPTAIQQAAVPVVLAGQDLLAQAPTGAGKTLAYAAPLLQRLMLPGQGPQRRTRALVLAPTRELAQQVGEVLASLARALPLPLRVRTVLGGVSINPQMLALRGGTDVLVATPGRLLDLLDHNALRLDGLQLLVLDEADRLLDLGFADEWARLQPLMPGKRQTLLFSATYPPAVQALADQWLRRPVLLAPGSGTGLSVVATQEGDTNGHADADTGTDAELPAPRDAAPAELPPDITQRAIEVDLGQRTPLLRHLIATHGWPQVLVFVASQYASELVADKLCRAGIGAAALHGGLSQGRRRQALQDFRSGRLAVLVATDLAARGLDIAGLPVVVNHDLPRSAADHTHRIGRTGRAGLAGLAISFISADGASSNTEAHFRLIEKRQQQRVPREQVPGFEPKVLASAEQAVGGVKGQRISKKDKLRAARNAS